MVKIFIGSVFSAFVLMFWTTADAAMYDNDGNRVFGRQNHMRHGTYDPRLAYKQFEEKRVSVQKKIKRSFRKKKKYISCDLTQEKTQQYRLSLLKFQQGAPRKCREDVRYILNLPYKTKSKKNLRPYEWKTKGY